MRLPRVIDSHNKFLPVSIQSSLIDVKKLLNDELAVAQHIKGVVNR